MRNQLIDTAPGDGWIDAGYALVLVGTTANVTNVTFSGEDARLFVDGGSLQQQDFIRVGLSGTLADYVLKDATGTATTLSAMSWNGQPAGYAADPADIVNYVSKHDNETLWDKLQYGLPADVSRCISLVRRSKR